MHGKPRKNVYSRKEKVTGTTTSKQAVRRHHQDDATTSAEQSRKVSL